MGKDNILGFYMHKLCNNNSNSNNNTEITLAGMGKLKRIDNKTATCYSSRKYTMTKYYNNSGQKARASFTLIFFSLLSFSLFFGDRH